MGTHSTCPDGLLRLSPLLLSLGTGDLELREVPNPQLMTDRWWFALRYMAFIEGGIWFSCAVNVLYFIII